MKTCIRCNYSFAKDVKYCHKCGYDPLKPSVYKQKQSTSKSKILIGAGIILVVIIVSVFATTQ